MSIEMNIKINNFINVRTQDALSSEINRVIQKHLIKVMPEKEFNYTFNVSMGTVDHAKDKSGTRAVE